jgi:hypothetical protein
MEIKKLFESREIPDQKISESKLETIRELNNQSMRESGEEKYELTEDEKRKIREIYPDFPDEIIDAIDNPGEILSKKRSLETVREMNNQPIQESKEEKHGLTEDEKKKIKEAHPDWPDEIIDAIGSWEEYEVYHKAGLEYAEINGKPCLIRDDIDWDQKDEFGRTNRERVNLNPPLSPINKDGKVIELHHVGQKTDSPFAELTKDEHRGKGNDTTLHDKNIETEAHTPENESKYQAEKKEHWQERCNKDAEVKNV